MSDAWASTWASSKVVLPRPSEPIYPPERAPSKRDPVPRFEDATWPVRFFSNNPSMQNVRIHWSTFPRRYVEHFRLAVWALFNLPVPDETIAQRAVTMVSTLSALRIYHNAIDYRMFGRWLEARDVPSISEVTSSVMSDYAEYLRDERRVARGTAVNHLTAITRLWVAGLQIPQLALASAPPWVTGRINDYLPPATGTSGENDTEPLATATIFSLLNSAIHFIQTGSKEILQAVALERAIYDHARNSVGTGGGSGTGKLHAYFNKLRAADAELPTKIHNARLAIDNSYIAYINDVPLNSVYKWAESPEVRAYARSHGAPTTVRLAGNDLIPDTAPLADVPAFTGLLRGACFIVTAYLTGMRPGEVLALEAGSLRPSSKNGGWMLLHSRTFKTARDENGNHDSNGEVRPAPWVAITPVIQAIQALEGLVDSGLLFPSRQHLKNAGRSVGLSTAANSVIRFSQWVNERKPGTIPEDPAGRVSPSRFRRTLAWHIANQPGGLVALAVQYGHLRTAISEGYASRVRDGIQDMIDFEAARVIAMRLAETAEAIDNGEGISGPATLRFVDSLREQTAQFNGIITSQKQALSLLRNKDLAVIQNDDAFVWCNFKRETALCLTADDPDDAMTPRLERCKANCSNIARTDAQAQGLRDRAGRFRDDASTMPQPGAQRLIANAESLEAQADDHARNRRTQEDFNAGV